MTAQRLRTFRPSRRGLAAPLLCALVLVVVAGTVRAQPFTETFEFTGEEQTWAVPDNVCEITIEATGAQGGEGPGPLGAPGGNGGSVTATVTVTPAETLAIFVGGQGGASSSGGAAGFNGGGGGGAGTFGAGGGGGGASDVRRGAFALTDRLVVAGGGGGGGGFPGGAGGGLTGSNGTGEDSAGGGGGTQAKGGDGGATDPEAADGATGRLGGGGAGGNGVEGGGGGGGGYYGGGGGEGPDNDPPGGGGGGSSFTAPGASGVSHTPGNHEGNGAVEITYEPDPISCAQADLAIAKTATVNEDATVVFILEASNTGPDAASGVTVSDPLPACTRYLSDTCGGVNVPPWTWTIGDLAGDASASCTVTVDASGCIGKGQQTNTATVAGDQEDRTPDNNTDDADFTAAAPELSIGGTIVDENEEPVAGVTVALSGDRQAEVTTDADGVFAFADLPWGGSYTVTPTHPDYDLQPPSRSFNPLEANETIAFTATALTATYTRYFGEGAIGAFFDTTFALFNPTDEDASATLRFAGETGEVVPHTVPIPAQTQVVVDPETLLPAEWVGFATAIEADQTLVTSRTMRWDDRHYGRHESAGVATPQTEWWFTEGATGTFQLFYLLYNPGDAAAEVTATYYRGGEQPPVPRTYTVAPHARRTVFVNVAGDGVTPDPDLGNAEVSAHIVSTNGVPIVAERAVYLTTNAAQPLTAGTMAPAVTEPAESWHFAEGATAFFDLFLLLANPSTAPVDATVRYLLPTGEPVVRTYPLEPESRRTIWVDQEDAALAETQVAITVQSDTPILAERAMWWGANGAWDGGHVSTGAAQPATRWGLAGVTLGGPDTAEAYVLIANPNAAAAEATLTLVTPEGASAPMTLPLGAWSRTTLRLADVFPDAGDAPVAVLVESTGGENPVPLVVEGAAYASPDGQPLTTGSATPALPLLE